MVAAQRADVERFRAVVTRHLGLSHDEAKLEFLANVLRERMDVLGAPDFASYAERFLVAATRAEEVRALAEHLTVGETFFFRNSDQFRALSDHVLPRAVEARSGARRLRILSAGCASGEEPYSLAILLEQQLAGLPSWDVEIVGIDVNPAALSRARGGRYGAWALRATPEETRRRYFRPAGREFELDACVRRMVAFEERNLVLDDSNFWQKERFDVVLCRNVIMYFTPDVMRDVVKRLTVSLAPHGFLFLGHAETLRGLTGEFHLCHTHDTFYYQRRDPVDARPRALDVGASEGEVGPLPDVVQTTSSWIDVIQKASDRIAMLADERGTIPARVSSASIAAPRSRSWDLGLILEAMRQERYADALGMLAALPADAAHEPDTLLLRAVLLANAGQLEEAESVCTRLLVIDELNAGAHYVTALCREHAGDAGGAVEHDRMAAYLDAAFAMPRMHLGLMARRVGDAGTARRELEQALLLLSREEASTLLLFGGGFSRTSLMQLCKAELRALGGSE